MSLLHTLLATGIAGAAGFTMATSALVLRAERRSARLRDRIRSYTEAHEPDFYRADRTDSMV